MKNQRSIKEEEEKETMENRELKEGIKAGTTEIDMIRKGRENSRKVEKKKRK